MYSLSLWLALGAFGMALGCPWVDFGAHLAPFGLPLGPLESLGGPLGSLGDPLGVPWNALGGALGVAWGAHGNFIRFVRIWTSNSEQMCLMCRACAQNLASRNSPANHANPPDPAKVAYGPQLATPLPRAGG